MEEILRVLPSRWHEQFLSEYCDRSPEVLHLWRLRAAAYSGPRFEEALQAVREDRASEFVAAEEVPGWSDRQ